MLPVKQFSLRLKKSSESGRLRKFKLPDSTLSARFKHVSVFGRALVEEKLHACLIGKPAQVEPASAFVWSE